jgi:hypothetical protein
MIAALKEIAGLLKVQIIGRDRRDLLIGLRTMNNPG